MGTLRNCFRYLALILAYVGSSRGRSGYVKGMRIQIFFHIIMSGRRCRNAIQFFLVNGVLVEGVNNV
jgi:hypothetical protein